MITVKSPHEEIFQHTIHRGMYMVTCDSFDATITPAQNLHNLKKKKSHVAVHYWESTSSFIYKIKKATVDSHLNNLRLCKATHHLISAPFDE